MAPCEPRTLIALSHSFWYQSTYVGSHGKWYCPSGSRRASDCSPPNATKTASGLNCLTSSAHRVGHVWQIELSFLYSPLDDRVRPVESSTVHPTMERCAVVVCHRSGSASIA